MALMLCLFRGAASLVLATQQFTLGWTHSIEKTRWEEDWRITPKGLQVFEARIAGSAAGMEPPVGAMLRDGIWHYPPGLPPQSEVVLSASEFTADHELCVSGTCRPLHAWIAGTGPVRLQGCEH